MEFLDKPKLRAPRVGIVEDITVSVTIRGREVIASIVDISESGLGLLFHEGEEIDTGDRIEISGKLALVKWTLPIKGGIASGVMLL